MAHFAVVKTLEDASFGLLYFPCEINCNVFYKRGKMAIIISDERDLGSGTGAPNDRIFPKTSEVS